MRRNKKPKKFNRPERKTARRAVCYSIFKLRDGNGSDFYAVAESLLFSFLRKISFGGRSKFLGINKSNLQHNPRRLASDRFCFIECNIYNVSVYPVKIICTT